MRYSYFLFFICLAVGRPGLHAQIQQSNIGQSGFQVSWQSNSPGSAFVFYGTSPDNLDKAKPAISVNQQHIADLTGLVPGTIYWVQTVSINGADTMLLERRPFATQSLSSGQIKVYFTQGIDTLAAPGIQPNGTDYASTYTELITRIQQAQQTIDVAMYNNNRDDLVQALQLARLRGIRIRYIAAQATNNYALTPPPGFPVVYGNADALMHNKFLVIDADLPDASWVMSGSMNWTVSNMLEDCNNVIWIQDQALARAYELEFEEMWGSTGAQPDLSASRFGDEKTDNTPHQFIIGGRQVESYFSPSDRVTDKLVNTLMTTDHQSVFATFSFTHNTLGNTYTDLHNSGYWIRGIIENTNDNGTEYNKFLSNGVPVQGHPGAGLLHHKYAVVDAGYPSAEPVVITGSHNWSYSAEQNNDENTLILHDADIAAMFQAEFERRWGEISTNTSRLQQPAFSCTPNPARDRLFLTFPDQDIPGGHIEIHNSAGRLVLSQNFNSSSAEIEISNLPAGNYLITLKTKRGAASLPVQKVSH
ncbi:MAG: T9SS type A sorting domain-containing protein [Bacteroidetes bacterium]|nr:MAG: T9SS type A sorting domain-containing protein [Bacteroidota bacterium]